MNSATANAKYIAGVAVHRAGGEFDMRFVYANPQRVNPILADRKCATEFSNATEAQANANQAIREHAERGDFSQHMASAHVLTVRPATATEDTDMNAIEISDSRLARGYIPAIIMKGKTHAVHYSWLQRGKPVVFVDAGYDALSACNIFSNPLGAIRAAERAADAHENAVAIVLENNHPDAVDV